MSWLIHTHAALVHVERERAWGRAAIEIGVELGRVNRYDVVVSSGPPHMVHDAGRTMALAAAACRSSWIFETRGARSS